jgi:hypothetical protein
MGFDVNSSGSRPTNDPDKSAGVGRAAAIYARKPPPPGAGANAPTQGAAEHRPNVSHMGQLMRDLHGLKSNDPNAFSKVTASIATRLQEIAQSEPDEIADRLQRLADRFSQASRTGNLTALRPSEHTPVRGLHGAAAYAQANHEDRGEIRQEVRSAIDEVLSQYIDELPESTPTPTPALNNGLEDGTPTPKVLVSA